MGCDFCAGRGYVLSDVGAQEACPECWKGTPHPMSADGKKSEQEVMNLIWGIRCDGNGYAADELDKHIRAIEAELAAKDAALEQIKRECDDAERLKLDYYVEAEQAKERIEALDAALAEAREIIGGWTIDLTSLQPESFIKSLPDNAECHTYRQTTMGAHRRAAAWLERNPQ